MLRKIHRVYRLNLLERIKNNNYLSSFLILASGTAVSQLIPILVSPILARLYLPEDFGLLSLFLAVVSSVGMSVSGRYDLAMLLPRRISSAKQLLGLALWVTGFSSCASLFLIYLFKLTRSDFLGLQALQGWIFFIPLALMFTGMRTTLGYWANRNSDFRMLARIQLYQAITVSLVSIVFGLVKPGFPGLMISNIAGIFLGGIFLSIFYINDLKYKTLSVSVRKIVCARQYKEFPCFNASSAVLDGITMGLPVFFIASYYSGNVIGFYGMVLRVSNAPLSFVSSSVGQIHLRKMIDLVHNGGNVRLYFLKITGVLASIVSLPTIIFVLFSPWIFETVFGEKWREAGVYLQILMPSLAVRFVVSTLSFTIDATNNSHLGAIWKIIAFITTSIVFFIFAPGGDIYLFLKSMAINRLLLPVLLSLTILIRFPALFHLIDHLYQHQALPFLVLVRFRYLLRL